MQLIIMHNKWSVCWLQNKMIMFNTFSFFFLKKLNIKKIMVVLIERIANELSCFLFWPCNLLDWWLKGLLRDINKFPVFFLLKDRVSFVLNVFFKKKPIKMFRSMKAKLWLLLFAVKIYFKVFKIVYLAIFSAIQGT